MTNLFEIVGSLFSNGLFTGRHRSLASGEDRVARLITRLNTEQPEQYARYKDQPASIFNTRNSEQIVHYKLERFYLLDRDQSRCVYCEASPDTKQLFADQVIPYEDLPITHMDNLAIACGDCNNGKSRVGMDQDRLRKILEMVHDRNEANFPEQQWGRYRRDFSLLTSTNFFLRIGKFISQEVFSDRQQPTPQEENRVARLIRHLNAEQIEHYSKYKDQPKSIFNPKNSERFVNYKIERRYLYDRDQSRCGYCGEKSQEDELAPDHIIPHKLIPITHVDNLVLACGDCNNGKSDLVLFKETLREILEMVHDRNEANFSGRPWKKYRQEFSLLLT